MQIPCRWGPFYLAIKRASRKPKRRRPAWSEAHVRRAFWRAGFGATPEEQRLWARRGRTRTVRWLLDGGGPAELRGPEPSADGKPLDPVNEFGHDVLWWLDRMVRTTRPLEEKLTLFWHDHFATADQDTPLMLAQNETLRAGALGRFDDLLLAVMLDPAMQLFLSLAGSHRSAPNENFARELMELFTLGEGYTEDDVREAARALTGYVAVRENGRVVRIDFDPARHDDGEKTIFGRRGRHGPRDVLRLCIEHPAHPGFLVSRLWAFFVDTPIRDSTRAKLAKLYVRSGRQLRPVVARILEHPHLYAGLDRPGMVKAPVVLVAGQLRAMGGAVDRRAWIWHTAAMGQRLFDPPSVAGWEWGPAWMSTHAMRTRFVAASELIRKGGPAHVPDGSVDPALDAAGHLAAARAAVGHPQISGTTKATLRAYAAAAGDAHPDQLQRTLRHLLIASPENQLC